MVIGIYQLLNGNYPSYLTADGRNFRMNKIERGFSRIPHTARVFPDSAHSAGFPSRIPHTARVHPPGIPRISLNYPHLYYSPQLGRAPVLCSICGAVNSNSHFIPSREQYPAVNFYTRLSAFALQYFSFLKPVNSMSSRLPYVQFLSKFSTTTPIPSLVSSKRHPLRELLSIQSPDVHDLDIPTLWNRISASLDGEITPEERHFVVFICGELRDSSIQGRSWAM
jgi:hypothetical protein